MIPLLWLVVVFSSTTASTKFLYLGASRVSLETVTVGVVGVAFSSTCSSLDIISCSVATVVILLISISSETGISCCKSMSEDCEGSGSASGIWMTWRSSVSSYLIPARTSEMFFFNYWITNAKAWYSDN